MVEFSAAVLSSGETDLTVGAFLGIWNGRTLVVGSLCDISLHKLADGQQSEPATGRVDLLGELILDKPGAGYFQRGVTSYPRIGSPIVPVGHDELCIMFDIGRARTRSMSGTCSRTLRSAPISTSTTWCASISRSSAAPAPASRARSRVLLREIMEARQNLRILLD